jgi:hypothetical protein
VNFQQSEHGGDPSDYAAGWNNINPCSFYVEVQGINQYANTAQVLAHWTLLSGTACAREEADHEYFLVVSQDHARWLIDAVKARG